MLAFVGGANLARVSHFMVDANATAFSGAPHDEFFCTHNCLTAYYRAAVAQRDGATNIYDPAVYFDDFSRAWPRRGWSVATPGLCTGNLRMREHGVV